MTALSIAVVVAWLILLFFLPKLQLSIVLSICGGSLIVMVLGWLLVFLPTPWTKCYICNYRYKLRQGYLLEYLEKIRHNPWFVLTTKDKYEYTILCNSYLFKANCFKESYEVLKNLSENRLLTHEKDEIICRKMLSLKMMGANSTALNLYAQINQENITAEFVVGLISEEQGDIQHSQDINRRLHDKLTLCKMSAQEKAVIHNNYGRIFKLQGNNIAAIDQYKQAMTDALCAEDCYQYAVSGNNLISTLLSSDVVSAKISCQEFLEKIATLPESKWRYYIQLNTKVLMAQGTDDPNELTKIIKGISYTEDNFSQRELIQSLVTSIILLNQVNGLDNETIERLNELIDSILAQPMPFRYFCARSLAYNLCNINDPALANTKDKLVHYLNAQAYKDVCVYIDQVQDYEVFEKCNMLKEKTIIEKVPSNEFLGLRDDFKQIANVLKINGVDIQYYYTLLEILLESLHYNHAYENEISEIVIQLDDILSKEKENIIFAVCHLQFSFYLLHIGQVDRAKEYYNNFLYFKIPALCLAPDLYQHFIQLQTVLARY
ncbi:MAG: hypothetical protein J1F65_02640 [Clostridiales bacterium]|nr:hypothetical protein [Clostridiales bacterium]